MPRLFEKLRSLRARRRQGTPPAEKRQKPKRRNWPYIAGGLILALAAYFWFTSARLLQEPIRLNYGVADAEFVSALGPLVGAEFTAGNKVQTLVNGDELFPAMLDAIRGAQKNITLESYIWSSGYISNQFIDALSERARAGVKVHVIVDGMGTLKLNSSDRQRMRDAGVEIYGYGREHWYEIKPHINHRTHRKILVIDGKVGFTGGMCIDDAWLGDAEHAGIWRETQVRVEGPVVRQMQAVFATNWMQTTSRLLLGEDYFPVIEKAGPAPALCYRSGPSEGPENARLGYLFAIAAARERIEIANAYFIPDDLSIDLLVEALGRGVRVRIIVPAINDSAFGRAASRSRWGELLAAGAEMYLYHQAMFHAKTMVVDRLLVTIGSANFDNRSFSINDEITLKVLDRQVAAEHQRIFERDLQGSRRLTREEFEHRPFYVKWADHFAGLFWTQL